MKRLYRERINLDTGDMLIWESFENIEAPRALFNALMRRTGSYTSTKKILRNQYNVFTFIEPSIHRKD
jgi:hypothetical protein